MDQEKTTFTCPFGTYAYRRMPFGLCNAPATFQRCMLEIFHDMIEESVEVFMEDFSVFGNSFDKCLNNLDKMLQHCKDAHLVLNWGKCHFMVKEGIVLGHKVSSAGLEVDKAKIDVISILPPPTNIKEFDIEIKDRKGMENVNVGHLSRIENDEISDDSEVDDNFPGETLMEINTKDEPWWQVRGTVAVRGGRHVSTRYCSSPRCQYETSIFDEFSLPRPPEESNSEISDATIESLSPSPIPVEDSDSLMEEIDLFLASDDSMPSGIEIVDYDSEGDIRFLEELLSSDSPPLPENESFSLDHFDDPSLPRPPPEPPDVEICFDFKPDAGVVTKKVVGDISEHDVLMPDLLPKQPTLCPVFDFLLPFSSENEDKVFKPGIFSSPFSSHRAKITFDFSESPMMISGGDIPHLDVPYLHFYPP
ncbi:reverse transcriptase domain-containing protein [Tanacetum coccineum]|uniref:Reverse transcriptase domain-containing protein n=1 Tax=Tanacetum coccineum TaxID=301880 RepID=A0ABQ5D8L1_9ASTR